MIRVQAAATATSVTQKMNQPSKLNKNIRNENVQCIRMQSQIGKWRKELSVVGENGTVIFYGKLNRKERKIFLKIQ